MAAVARDAPTYPAVAIAYPRRQLTVGAQEDAGVLQAAGRQDEGPGAHPVHPAGVVAHLEVPHPVEQSCRPMSVTLAL